MVDDNGVALSGKEKRKACRRRLERCRQEYGSFTSQFSTLILISTFTAALVIAFLTFSRDALLKANETIADNLYMHIGTLLGFLATATHLLIIIIAGRASTLCHQIQALGKRPRDVSFGDFHLYFYSCEQLHFLATALFLITLLFLSFALFHPLITHSVILYVFTCVSLLLVYRTGFWKVSTLGDDWNLVKELFFRGFCFNLPTLFPCGKSTAPPIQQPPLDNTPAIPGVQTPSEDDDDGSPHHKAKDLEGTPAGKAPVIDESRRASLIEEQESSTQLAPSLSSGTPRPPPPTPEALSSRPSAGLFSRGASGSGTRGGDVESQ